MIACFGPPYGAISRSPASTEMSGVQPSSRRARSVRTVPAVPAVAIWPQRLHLDPGHRWFRGVVGEVVTRVLAEKV